MNDQMVAAEMARVVRSRQNAFDIVMSVIDANEFLLNSLVGRRNREHLVNQIIDSLDEVYLLDLS